MRALRKHCQTPWVLLYVERWLKAPMQMSDGALVERTRGTPQGVFDYIEMFYNPKRRHSFSNELSPVEYEKQYLQRLASVYKTRGDSPFQFH